MTTEILNGQPPQPADEALLKAYHDAVIKQADLYVDLAKELLKLELAIPGIYAAALKLVTDQSPHALLVAAAFGCWRCWRRCGRCFRTAIRCCMMRCSAWIRPNRRDG